MTVLYSDQYQAAFVTEPKSKLAPMELHGRMRRAYGEVTLSAEIATTDVLKVMKIPANAVPVKVRMVAPGGTAGTLDLGWAAGESEVADANGLIAAMSGAAAIDSEMGYSDAGHNKRFSEEVDMELSVSVLTAGFIGDKIQIEMWYVID